MASPRRPRPAADPLTKPFWDSAHRHVLAVQRCGACAVYQHPPQLRCHHCGSTSRLGYEPVSGSARVVSWTRVCQGLVAGFEDVGPYVNVVVELVEQPGLFMVTDHPGADPAFFDRLRTGAPMQVRFEEVEPGLTLPQFRFEKDDI